MPLAYVEVVFAMLLFSCSPFPLSGLRITGLLFNGAVICLILYIICIIYVQHIFHMCACSYDIPEAEAATQADGLFWRYTFSDQPKLPAL